MISCDDFCKVFMNTTHPWDKANPVATNSIDMEELAIRTYAIEWRNNFLDNVEGETTQQKSDWVALTEG